MFLNLQTLKFYCLPDNYEIIDPSLEDIQVKNLRFHIEWFVVKHSLDFFFNFATNFGACFYKSLPPPPSLLLLKFHASLFQYLLKPTYTKELIASLDGRSKMSRAYDDSTYYPGVVGLNNIKANDYCNVVFHVSFCCYSLKFDWTHSLKVAPKQFQEVYNSSSQIFKSFRLESSSSFFFSNSTSLSF